MYARLDREKSEKEAAAAALRQSQSAAFQDEQVASPFDNSDMMDKPVMATKAPKK
jgi:hypothetical protein